MHKIAVVDTVCEGEKFAILSVLRIRDILVRIRIRASVPLIRESESSYFRQ